MTTFKIDKIKASSTLEKEFNVKNLLDGDSSTCWSSQGSKDPQWIQVVLENACVLEKVRFMFQGGFVGRKVRIEGRKGKDWVDVGVGYMEDRNELQTMELDKEGEKMKRFRILFEESSDFYGRITLYVLEFIGKE